MSEIKQEKCLNCFNGRIHIFKRGKLHGSKLCPKCKGRGFIVKEIGNERKRVK